MSITVTCAKCGKVVKAPGSPSGRKGKCPGCGATIEIPAATDPAAAPKAVKAKPVKPASAPAAETRDTSDDEPTCDSSVDALALAIDAAAGPPPPSPEEAVDALAGSVPAPVTPEPAPPVTSGESADGDTPAVLPAADDDAQVDSDEMIAVPPVGVQTPSGLPAPARGRAMAFRWQRRLAGYVRVAGLALGGLALAVGIVAMVLLASKGPDMLMPGIGIFVVTLVVGAMVALGGLLGRHVLILLADLGEDVRGQETLLDRIIERLD
jgi:phage FluMu protein Com